jgi:hypothetical protein
MKNRFNEAEKRINIILGKKFNDISRSDETLAYYKEYLEKELKFPVEVCGIEDFSWEEFYLLGPGDKHEYEVLKRTRASYTDILKMTSLSNYMELDYGLFAKFTRISDKKRFELPLADFKCLDKKSENAMLLDDYSIWFVNN